MRCQIATCLFHCWTWNYSEFSINDYSFQVSVITKIGLDVVDCGWMGVLWGFLRSQCNWCYWHTHCDHCWQEQRTVFYPYPILIAHIQYYSLVQVREPLAIALNHSHKLIHRPRAAKSLEVKIFSWWIIVFKSQVELMAIWYQPTHFLYLGRVTIVLSGNALCLDRCKTRLYQILVDKAFINFDSTNWILATSFRNVIGFRSQIIIQTNVTVYEIYYLLLFVHNFGTVCRYHPPTTVAAIFSPWILLQDIIPAI